MRGRIIDFAVGFNKKQRLTVELDADFREKYDALHEFDVDVTVKKYRAKRSLDANAYAWVLIDKIAAASGRTKDDIYRDEIKRIGGVSEVVCVREAAVERLRQTWSKYGMGWQTEVFDSEVEGFKNLILYYGSSSYDTKQMSILIDRLVQDAQSLGIETMPPEQLESLLAERK